MFKITERVETGYFGVSTKGGTLYVSVELWDIPIPEDVTIIKKIVDMLDHSTITDIEDIANLSTRFFHISNITNIYDDVISIVCGFVELAGISYSSISVEFDGCMLTRGYNEVKGCNMINYGIGE